MSTPQTDQYREVGVIQFQFYIVQTFAPSHVTVSDLQRLQKTEDTVRVLHQAETLCGLDPKLQVRQ